MEVVEGMHYDAMCLADQGELLLTTIKTREASRWGIIVKGELIYKPELIENNYIYIVSIHICPSQNQ